jgi:hypothetical protein
MDNRTNFIISAFVALFLYVFLIVLFLYYTKNDVVKKIDAVNKVTVLQLDVILNEENQVKEKITIKSGVKNKDIAKKVVKKTTSVSMKQRSNLKSLFANVKTSAKKVRKAKVLNVKQSSISSRFKSKFEKEKKVKNVTLSNLIDNKNTQSNLKKVVLSESKNENDPYFSKIYQMLSSRWNPTVFVDDLQAKVLITILNNGEFSFKFIQYSANSGFNDQLKQFLYDESLNLYPVNPNNKTTNIEILFQSKG